MAHLKNAFRNKAKIAAGLSVLACLCLSVTVLLTDALAAEEIPATAAAVTQAKLLEGRWIRPDGGYILELNNISADGTLAAVYYNPRPIRVFQAFWAMDDGLIRVFVELRDTNYPGSKYSLRYDSPTDRLHGFYFQAVEQQSYEVEFIRNR
jgi:hypothetical protein